MYRSFDPGVDRWNDLSMDRWIKRSIQRSKIAQWIDRWIDGSMDRSMDGSIDVSKGAQPEAKAWEEHPAAGAAGVEMEEETGRASPEP